MPCGRPVTYRVFGADRIHRAPADRRKDAKQIGDLGPRVRVERNAAVSVGLGALDLEGGGGRESKGVPR